MDKDCTFGRKFECNEIDEWFILRLMGYEKRLRKSRTRAIHEALGYEKAGKHLAFSIQCRETRKCSGFGLRKLASISHSLWCLKNLNLIAKVVMEFLETNKGILVNNFYITTPKPSQPSHLEGWEMRVKWRPQFNPLNLYFHLYFLPKHGYPKHLTLLYPEKPHGKQALKH